MLRIGVVGIGHMGKIHLFILSKLKDVKFIGVADRAREEAKGIKLAIRAPDR